MVLDWLNRTPAWMLQLLWSAVTLLLIVLMGRLIGRILCRRLARWAAQTAWKWDDALHEFIKRLLARYRQEGITIPFPTQTVYREDGG